MKIIDLLNKIANDDEVPKKIKIGTHIFTKYNYPMGDGTFVSSYGSNNDGEYHINDFLYPQYLNNEIEILEEKKIPEKLDKYADVSGDLACDWTFGEKKLKDKVNEIIDYLDYLKSKGDE